MNKKNSWVTKGLVSKITDGFIQVTTEKGEIFTIHANQITDRPKVKIKNTFKYNDLINFYVTYYDKNARTGIGSFITNHPNFSRAPFTFKLEPTQSGFTNLEKFTLEDINGNSEN